MQKQNFRTLCLVLIGMSTMTYGAEINPVRAYDTVKVAADVAEGWSPDVDLRLTLSDASFDNWAAGGENAFLWETGADADLKYRRGSFLLALRAKAAWGQSQGEGRPLRKSRDELRLEARADRLWSERWSTYFGARAETQWSDGFDEKDSLRPLISQVLDPMALTQGAGLAWRAWKGFEVRSGAAIKETWSRDFAYADDPLTPSREHWRLEPGVEALAKVKRVWKGGLSYRGEFRVFNSFKSLSRTDLEWRNKLSLAWNDRLLMSIELDRRYDYDLSPNPQSRRLLAAGLQWSPWGAPDSLPKP